MEKKEVSAKPCNKCGQLIIFGQLWDKTWVALTNQVECYRVIKGFQVKKDEGTFILHRLVCPGEPKETIAPPGPPLPQEPQQEEFDIRREQDRYPT